LRSGENPRWPAFNEYVRIICSNEATVEGLQNAVEVFRHNREHDDARYIIQTMRWLKEKRWHDIEWKIEIKTIFEMTEELRRKLDTDRGDGKEGPELKDSLEAYEAAFGAEVGADIETEAMRSERWEAKKARWKADRKAKEARAKARAGGLATYPHEEAIAAVRWRRKAP
jgi:hypothetical protein